MTITYLPGSVTTAADPNCRCAQVFLLLHIVVVVVVRPGEDVDG